MISIIKWSLTSRLSIKTPLSLSDCRTAEFPGYATSSGPQIKLVPKGSPDACRLEPFDPSRERESSLLTTYWSGSTDVFGGPALRHGSLNSLFQVALYLPS
jgi:hypothetical protein